MPTAILAKKRASQQIGRLLAKATRDRSGQTMDASEAPDLLAIQASISADAAAAPVIHIGDSPCTAEKAELEPTLLIDSAVEGQAFEAAFPATAAADPDGSKDSDSGKIFGDSGEIGKHTNGDEGLDRHPNGSGDEGPDRKPDGSGDADLDKVPRSTGPNA
eukprot:12669135-Alexandrium_andersonii.AAC.1